MIRSARSEDAAQIRDLWNDMIRDTLSTFTTVEKTEPEIQAMIAARADAFWVAEQAGNFAGFLTFGGFRGGPGYARTVEHSILVTHEAKGTGSAVALLTAAEQGARKAGKHALIGGISHTNERALRFHLRHGFNEVGRLREVGYKFGQWLDLVLVQKLLNTPEHSR